MYMSVRYRTIIGGLFAIGVLLCLGFRSPSSVSSATTSAVTCPLHYTVGGETLTVPCSILGQTDPNSVERAVVLAGGPNVILQAARAHGVDDQTFIIGVSFPESPSDGGIYWTGEMRFGSDAVNAPGLSSFDVFDDIIKELAASYPALRQITVTGYSWGGQYANRYAVFTSVPTEISQPIAFRYVVAAGARYMYFDSARWNQDTWNNGNGTFDTSRPFDSACYFIYDSYPWGADYIDPVLFSYLVEEMENVDLFQRYRQRDVYYLVGQEDTTVSSAESHCADMLQGPNRLDRVLIYHRYMTERGANHQYAVISEPGTAVDHSRSDLVYASAEGREALFPPLTEVSPEPSLSMSPTWGPYATSFTATGSYFVPGETVSVWLVDPQGQQTSPESYTADPQGSFRATVEPPAVAGTYTLYAQGNQSGLTLQRTFTLFDPASIRKVYLPLIRR